MTTKEKTIEPNDEKLKELILYIASRSEGDDYFGATKLNKLLFFADFIAYLNFGQPITGHEYQALERGPAPRRFVPIRDEMQANGDIAFRLRDFYGLAQHRIFSLREPNLDLFSAEEIDLVNRLIFLYWDKSAAEISSDSHQFAGWKYATYGEIIPYQVALVGTRELTDAELDFADTLEAYAAEVLTA